MCSKQKKICIMDIPQYNPEGCMNEEGDKTPAQTDGGRRLINRQRHLDMCSTSDCIARLCGGGQ